MTSNTNEDNMIRNLDVWEKARRFLTNDEWEYVQVYRGDKKEHGKYTRDNAFKMMRKIAERYAMFVATGHLLTLDHESLNIPHKDLLGFFIEKPTQKTQLSGDEENPLLGKQLTPELEEMIKQIHAKSVVPK